MTSGRRLYLALKFEGIWPITGEGRVMGVAWFMVVLTGSRERGNARAQDEFIFSPEPHSME